MATVELACTTLILYKYEYLHLYETCKSDATYRPGRASFGLGSYTGNFDKEFRQMTECKTSVLYPLDFGQCVLLRFSIPAKWRYTCCLRSTSKDRILHKAVF